MSNIRGLKQKLATVSKLREEKAYGQALAEVETLIKTWPGNPHLHVLRAKLVQLQDEPKYDLDEAKQALQQAIELDKSSPAALIELGYFLDNIEDDPTAAVKSYGEGVTAARHLLIDGLIGQAKAYRQLEKRDDFFRCLLEVLQLTQFDSGPKRNGGHERGPDIIFQSPSGPVYIGQLKGPFEEQIRDLLSELDAERLAESGAASERGRKAGPGK